MRLLLTLLIIFISKITLAELIKPNPDFLPEEVVSIQLIALQNNNIPFKNAGIEQTWKFAHPYNRNFTGPLSKFISMMHTPSYSILLNHIEHNIVLVKNSDIQTFFFVELLDNKGVKIGFKWIVEKALDDGEYKNCWMTSSVSLPLQLFQPI